MNKETKLDTDVFNHFFVIKSHFRTYIVLPVHVETTSGQSQVA